MLELIQQRFQTVVLLLIVLALSAVFILQFGGPQARGCTESIQETHFAARVYGETITEGDFRAAYAVTNFSQYPTKQARTLRLRELTLDGLVERELLAHEAERIGFSADPGDVMQEFVETGVIYRNPPVDAPAGYPGPALTPIDFTDDGGDFSSKNMRRYINNHLRRSADEFTHWQVRERLAARMREAVVAQVTIAPEEVHDQYVRDTERAKLRYAQFREAYYQDRVDASPANVRAWTASHQSQVDEEYTRQRHRYTDLEPQVRARHILIKASESAPESDRSAARARAEELLHRAQAGEDFATLARDNSQDEGSAPSGGDLGWNARGRMVAPFDDAQFAMTCTQAGGSCVDTSAGSCASGTHAADHRLYPCDPQDHVDCCMSGTEPVRVVDHVVETQFGYHVIEVVGRRAGNVPEDDARLEIATGLYQADRASELAHEDAMRSLAFLREGHTMDELDAQLAANWAETPRPPPLPEGATEPPPPDRDPSAPQVRETRSFGHTDTPVSGAFDAGPLTRAAFAMTLEAPLPEEPMRLGSDWFVFQLTERTIATEAGLTDEVRQRISDSLMVTKRQEAVRAFVHGLRERAIADGQFRTDDAMLDYGDGGGEGDDHGGDHGEESHGEEESAIDRRLLDVPS
jgi:hypothetical protein